MGLIYMTINCVTGDKYIGKQWNENKKDYLDSGKILKLAIKKYGRKSFIKIILKCGVNDKRELEKLEELLIRVNNAPNRNDFYNLSFQGTAGGNTGVRKAISEETREKQRKAAIERSKNPEYIKKLSIAQKGKIRTAAEKQKLSEAHKNQKNLNLGKTVIQLDLKGNIIKEFISISEASRAVGKSSSSGSISNTCKKRNKTAFGYKWMYK